MARFTGDDFTILLDDSTIHYGWEEHDQLSFLLAFIHDTSSGRFCPEADYDEEILHTLSCEIHDDLDLLVERLEDCAVGQIFQEYLNLMGESFDGTAYRSDLEEDLD